MLRGRSDKVEDAGLGFHGGVQVKPIKGIIAAAMAAAVVSRSERQ